MYSVADTLRGMAPRIPPELVGAAELDRVLRVAQQLPAAVASWLYLECRLGDEAAGVDLIVGVEAPGRDILAGVNPALSFDAGLLERAEWARVRELCRRWADPASPLHGSIASIWLEFDVGDGGASSDLPGVFVDFTPATYGEGTAGERAGRALEVMAPLFADGVPRGMEERLRACYEALPEGAFVPYVGVLLPRGTETVRLCVGGIEPPDLPGYLRAVGWSGSGAALGALAERLAGTREGAVLADPALVHLDVGAGVGPVVGMEYVFDRPPQVRGVLPQAAFLDALVAEGLCTPEKRAALARWPGCSLERFAHELWQSLVIRRVNHVKVVFDGERAAQAKGYLSLHHRFHRRPSADSPPST
jgi:hypothetical protein